MNVKNQLNVDTIFKNMGGIFFAKDEIQSILSGRYFFTDCDTAGPICSLRVYRTHAYMRFKGLLALHKERI